MDNKTIDNQRLRHLTGLYFDGATTLDQERELRQLLALSPDRSAETEAARAVMGIFAVSRRASAHAKRRQRRLMPLLRVAAGLAILIAGTFALVKSVSGSGNDLMYTYVGASRISDSSLIADIVRTDLSSMAEASSAVGSEMASDLAIMGSVFDSSESINPNDL